MPSKAKINKQNTRHGKYDLPFTALNKYAGMAEGGDVKESKAMMKKEVSFMKKKGAPKSMIKHEMGEMKGYARGGGIESKGKTRGTMVKMARGGRVPCYDEGGDVEDTDAEGYGTKIERTESKPQSFKEAFAAHRTAGDKTFTWNGKSYTTELASDKPASSGPKMSSDGPMSRKALGRKPRSEPTVGEALAARFGTAGQRAEAKKEGRGNAFSGRFGTAEQRRRYAAGMAEGGSVKKYARGGGIELRGKTRGKFV